MIRRTHYLNQILPFIGTDVIKVITGIRRCGKSVLLEQIRDEIVARSPNTKIVYVDLEDKANAYLLKGDALFELLESKLRGRRGSPTAFLLDEVHDAEGWETTVNTIRKRKGADVYITGSNSKMLSGELATYLAGRYVEFQMAPFSYGEYIEAVRGSVSATGDALFMKYLEMGTDIVVSHHPHVPMNYEIVPALNTSDVENNDASAPDKSNSAMVTENKKLIIYSLGNFIFDTDYQRSQLNTDRGVILSLTLTADAFDFTAYGIKLDRQTERISLDKLPEIFENVPPDEYEKLIPLSAKAFVTATKKQYIYLYPEVYTNADHDKWMECFMDPERSGRMPGEGLDFEVIYPLALEAEKGTWKDSKLEGGKKYILDQL